MQSTTDRIEKHITLDAPIERVWRAITDAREFGDWFGFAFDGDFVPGKRVNARIKPTTSDPEIAKMQEKYAGMPFEFVIDKLEPMHTFSYRWHPFAIDKDVDYSNEPMTLVTFSLASTSTGTALTVVETGFDSLPAHRITDAYEANEEGWAMQMDLIEKHLRQHRS